MSILMPLLTLRGKIIMQLFMFQRRAFSQYLLVGFISKKATVS